MEKLSSEDWGGEKDDSKTPESFDDHEQIQRRTLLNAVREKISEQNIKSIVHRVILYTMVSLTAVSLLRGAKNALEYQPANSSSSTLFEEAAQNNRPSIFWMNDDELNVTVGNNSYTVSKKDANDIEHYRELGFSSDDAIFLVNEFNNLLSIRDGSAIHSEEISIRENEATPNSFLESYSEADLAKIKDENKAEIQRIIDELELEKSNDPIVTLRNCLKVHEYIVKANVYDNVIMDEKQGLSSDQMRDIDLHHGLVEKRSVCSSNSAEFQSILEEMGAKVFCVALSDVNDSNSKVCHMANLVEINGEYYYFDTTLEQSIYNNMKEQNQDQELVFCVAGLGRQDYEEFYKPVGVITSDMVAGDIPDNISLERIPPMVLSEVFEQD